MTRAGIIQHFTKENNVTDLTNKATAQQNLSILLGKKLNYSGNLIGLTASLLFSNTFSVTIGIVSIMSTAHLYTGLQSVRSIVSDDLNMQRLFILGKEFIESGKLLAPSDIYKREGILFDGMGNIKFSVKSFDFILNHSREKDKSLLVKLLNLFREKKFFTFPFVYFSFSDLSYKYKIYTCLRVDAEALDVLEAFLFTLALNERINSGFEEIELYEEILTSLQQTEKLQLKEMMDNIRKIGWTADLSSLEDKYCRYQILYKKK